jgi:hypothetical protein
VTLGTVQVAAVGQYVVPIYAYYLGTLYPYLRLQKTLNGPSPRITLNAFPLPFSGIASLSLADATAVFGLAAQNNGAIAASIVAWAAGTATGGPNSNGQYPIYDAAGDSVLVPCPASLDSTGSGAMYPDISTYFVAGDPDWTAAFNRAYAAGKCVSLSQSNYDISAPISIGSGGGIVGRGIGQNKITQTTANVAIIQLNTAQDAILRGMTLCYPTQQPATATSADAIVTTGGDTWRCFIEDLEILNSFRGLHVVQPFFSCCIRKFIVRSCSGSYIEFAASNFSTGNSWDDIYFANNLYTTPMAQQPVILRDTTEGHWGQLNIEHTQFEGAVIYATDVSNMQFSSIHMEDLTPFAENSCLLYADYASQLVIDVLNHVESNILHANSSGMYDFYVGTVGTQSSIEIGAFAEYTNTTNGVSYGQIKQAGANSAAPYSAMKVRRARTNLVGASNNSIQNNGGPALIPVLQQWDNEVFYTGGPGGMGYRTGTAPPTTGTYVVGEDIRNTAYGPGQPRGWACSVAGTPGTWQSYS